MKNICEDFLDNVPSKEIISTNISALNLAYMGDAVFEILVRTEVLKQGEAPVNALHKKCAEFVNAQTQSKIYHELIKIVTEEEMQVMKRGRNAKSFSKAKNATMSDYKHATGLEALFGYLFLKGETERLKYLFEKGIDSIT